MFPNDVDDETPVVPFSKPVPMKMITEIMFKNGTLMAVYGSRAEIIEKLKAAGRWNFATSGYSDDWIEVAAYSSLNPKSDGAIYSIAADEVYMVGVERPAPMPELDKYALMLPKEVVN